NEAITLVRDSGKILPLKPTGTTPTGLPYMSTVEIHNRVVVIVFSDDVRMIAGRAFERQVRARVPDANVLYVDPRIAAGMEPDVVKAVNEAETVVAAVYAVPVPGGLKNSVAVADATGQLLSEILANAANKTVVLAMGSPYLVADFPAIQTYICTFSNE